MAHNSALHRTCPQLHCCDRPRSVCSCSKGHRSISPFQVFDVEHRPFSCGVSPADRRCEAGIPPLRTLASEGGNPASLRRERRARPRAAGCHPPRNSRWQRPAVSTAYTAAASPRRAGDHSPPANQARGRRGGASTAGHCGGDGGRQRAVPSAIVGGQAGVGAAPMVRW